MDSVSRLNNNNNIENNNNNCCSLPNTPLINYNLPRPQKEFFGSARLRSFTSNTISENKTFSQLSELFQPSTQQESLQISDSIEIDNLKRINSSSSIASTSSTSSGISVIEYSTNQINNRDNNSFENKSVSNIASINNSINFEQFPVITQEQNRNAPDLDNSTKLLFNSNQHILKSDIHSIVLKFNQFENSTLEDLKYSEISILLQTYKQLINELKDISCE
eukprot:TRINITY_DN580_c1_g2_i1.p1 TRINITY_DN580_c1_g2~~TRINITY_DN580_c1_g2_i1.p1  ORF type:complete len:221 (+),score=83.30 TRINITY_DN580_c1_g2_i1:124-786(+)